MTKKLVNIKMIGSAMATFWFLTTHLFTACMCSFIFILHALQVGIVQDLKVDYLYTVQIVWGDS